MDYDGVIIEESLTDKNILNDLEIIKTKIEPVTERDHTPHLKQWTLHTVLVKEKDADVLAERLSKILETVHSHWYADYKNDKTHYIIFDNKIFKIDRTKAGEYEEASKYGISLGIPEYQVDFTQEVVR